MKVRRVRPHDAASVVTLMQKLDGESEFLLYEPGERSVCVEEQQEILTSFTEQSHKVMFVVENENALSGFLSATGSTIKRKKHVANFTMGLLKSAGGRGLGKTLLSHLEVWAEQNAVTRLELSVMCDNERAVGLYQSQGYQIEGTKVNSVKLKDRYVDGYLMAKILPEIPT
ncbi:GNAT family N-acetyltransferase [Veronia pacifica]|uniref:N-acetyltransferase domain-containing protein n=1 Tax=Veronia pacifica TaxID=1080227 RepID=A0A1C3ERL3_9GAMM|nr:GNAT family N-acetyltransferase [Veronia pacifica]ODA35883.1 hypothetical protein A8L45_02285 [Veronia pacifica]